MNEEAEAAEQQKGAPTIPETNNLQTNVSVDQPPVTKISVPGIPESKSRAPCKFFLTKRGCSYGSDCRFLHLPSSQPPESRVVDVKEEEEEEATMPHKSRPPVCRHYLSSRSGCKYGEKCRYRHPARPDRDKRQEKGADEIEKENERVSEESSSGDSTAVLSLSNFPRLGSAGEANLILICQLCLLALFLYRTH